MDLGAKGSCQIGGNASTNAGGKYVIKYGSFRSNILGLEAVLPDGTILNLESEIHKDNTGYDLKNLFIGSEGTLGIITKLNIHCKKIDLDRKLLVLQFDSYDKVLESVPALKAAVGKNLNALEYMDYDSYSTVVKHLHPNILDNVTPNSHLLFVELTIDDPESIIEKLPEIEDAVLSSNENEFEKMWKIREDVAPAAIKEGKVISYDLSFNVQRWPHILKGIREKFGDLVLGYGHIGDGNLHVNICSKNPDAQHD